MMMHSEPSERKRSSAHAQAAATHRNGLFLVEPIRFETPAGDARATFSSSALVIAAVAGATLVAPLLWGAHAVLNLLHAR